MTGVRPGLSSGELFINKDEFQQAKSKWEPVKQFYTLREKRMLVARMVEIGVRECFKNHT